MVLAGNHEIEQDARTGAAFTAFQHRFRMPSAESGAGPQSGNQWYSYDVPGAHFAVLNCYADTTAGAQHDWVLADLAAVDRARTPFLFVANHCPLYNSNKAHHNDGQAVDMLAALEDPFAAAGVDAVFAGHVHAYERSKPVYKNATNATGGITYINVGDGGNREGHYDNWLPGQGGAPQPAWSAVRRSEFGHGKLVIANATHAQWAWHRVVDGYKVVADEVWFTRPE